MSAVSPVVITKYFTGMAGQWKRTSVSFHVQSGRSFFRYASGRGWCAACNAESIDAPPTIHVRKSASKTLESKPELVQISSACHFRVADDTSGSVGSPFMGSGDACQAVCRFRVELHYRNALRHSATLYHSGKCASPYAEWIEQISYPQGQRTHPRGT
jgi:hypothetical protein